MRKIITPEYASFLLSKNHKNRQIKKIYLADLIEVMKRGDFVYNGETIIISDTGIVLDGQHRLLACEKSGVSIDVELIEGVSENVMPTIDTGVKRTAGDVLTLHGATQSLGTAKVIRTIIQFRQNKNFLSMITQRGEAITNQDILNFYLNEPEVSKAIVDSGANKAKINIMESSAIAAIWYVLKDINYEKANDFFSYLLYGGDDGVVNLLREKLIANATSNRKMSYRERTMLTFKAWDKYINGIPTKLLKVSSDEAFIFPNGYPKYGMTYIKNANIHKSK